MSKRLFDITIAGILCILSLPICIIIALCVHFKLGNPVFYRQIRPGLHGKPFRIVKFRTMHETFDADGNLLPDIDRLTAFGSFLRRTSLDELPELWNVLKGDMSLVGPRPLLQRYLERYSAEQSRRHEVCPGITGWAQVNGRNNLAWEERLAMDVWYVDNRSLLLDMKILALTVVKVFRREGVSAQGHATMPEFMGSDAQKG